jgi:phenylacetate-CoA ligase
MIMTNLELKAMPLIRYQTGDLAKVMEETSCTCGRQSRRIERIEGRIIDCIHLSDNSVISPYRLTLALENLAGLGRYQVLQNAIDKFTVRIEKNNFNQAAMQLNIQNALIPVLGPNAQFLTKLEDSITPPAGKKFRIIENLIGNTC